MSGLLFGAIIGAAVGAVAIISVLVNSKKTATKISKVIASIPDFEPGEVIHDFTDRFVFAVDKKSRTVAYYVPQNDDLKILKFEDIISVSLSENNNTLYEKSSQTRAIAGAIIGGALAGGAGAIVGGLSGGSKHEQRANITVKVLVRNQDYPSIIINCFDGITSAVGYEPSKRVAHQIADSCSVIIDTIDQEQKLAQSDSMQSKASVADELLKLSGLLEKGLLTEAEFEAQKKELLNPKL